MTNQQSPTVLRAHRLTISQPRRLTNARMIAAAAGLIRWNWQHNERFRGDVAFWVSLAAVAAFVACLPVISNITSVAR